MGGYVIAVYGANGHTGQFVAEQLKRRGCEPIAISRHDPDKFRGSGWGGAQWRRAECDRADELDAALQGVSAVINCAGPFRDTAPPVVEAALRQGIHYLDVTAEQRTALQTHETYRGQARARGIVILPAMAFYGGLADLLATQVSRNARVVESIDIAVALDSWHPTPGTRNTGDRNTARRLIVSQGVLAPLPHPAPKGRWKFPEPFCEQSVVGVPLSEIITISRHIAAQRVLSFMNEAPLRDLQNPRTPPPTAVDASGRSAQRFVIDVVASCDGSRRRLLAVGQDIYAVSASLVVEACLRILGSSKVVGGTFAAGELFEPAEFLSGLSPHLQTFSPEDTNPLEFV